MPTNFIKSYKAEVGLNHVPAYQASGRPWASGSIDAASGYVRLEFPFVTRWVYVTNHGTGSVKVGFSERGTAGANYFRGHGVTAAGNSDEVDVVAGLTTVPAVRTSGSTGPSWSGSAGVG